MGITEIIKEQATFGFTGRINIQLLDNGQYAGVILQQDGKLIHAEYAGFTGKKALFKAVVDDLEGIQKLKYIVEPEIIADGSGSFELTWKEFKVMAEKMLTQFRETARLKPPAHLRLVVDGDFIITGKPIDGVEFEVLCTISDYSKVEDVYAKSPLHEFEITRALVSLRKKGALKVVEAK